MATDFSPYNIRINAICPGGIETDRLRERMREIRKNDPDLYEKFKGCFDRYTLKRLATEEEIAKAALFLASDDSTYVTGSAFVVDGGMTAQQAAISEYIRASETKDLIKTILEK